MSSEVPARKEHLPARVSHGRRLQINPDALRIVPEAHRNAWNGLARQPKLDVAERFRKKWTDPETLYVILADPSESYIEIATRIHRSPGAVRYRRMAMVHLLRDEHGARERVQAYCDDPKVNHKHHDYYHVDKVLEEFGFYSMLVSEQFAIAKPLRQPSVSWRGDGTSGALGSELRELKKFLHDIMEHSTQKGDTSGLGE